MSVSIQEGDVLVSRYSGEWSISRVLKVDEKSSILHVMMYSSVREKPTLEEVQRTEPFVWHVPIALTPGNVSGDCIGNIPVTEDDLIGHYIHQEEVNAASKSKPWWRLW